MHISVIQALYQFATKEMGVSQRLSVPGAQHTYKQLMTMGQFCTKIHGKICPG
jgi:hypothetical protein